MKMTDYNGILDEPAILIAVKNLGFDFKTVERCTNIKRSTLSNYASAYSPIPLKNIIILTAFVDFVVHEISNLEFQSQDGAHPLFEGKSLTERNHELIFESVKLLLNGTNNELINQRNATTEAYWGDEQPESPFDRELKKIATDISAHYFITFTNPFSTELPTFDSQRLCLGTILGLMKKFGMKIEKQSIMNEIEWLKKSLVNPSPITVLLGE